MHLHNWPRNVVVINVKESRNVDVLSITQFTLFCDIIVPVLHLSQHHERILNIVNCVAPSSQQEKIEYARSKRGIANNGRSSRGDGGQRPFSDDID